MSKQLSFLSPGIPTIPFSFIIQGRFIFYARTFPMAMRRKYGEVLAVNDSGTYVVFCLSAGMAQEILTKEPSSFDAFFKEPFQGLTGPGSLWVLDGLRHKRERKLLVPSFQPRNYRAIAETIQSVARSKMQNWTSGIEISALDEMLSISLDIILRVVFGKLEGELIERGRKILSALVKSVRPLIVFFVSLQTRWFPFWRQYAKAKNEFSDWVKDILIARGNEQQSSDDVLNRMLSAVYEDGSSMTEEDVRDELITILLAGHETTATALSWALYELARHPDVLVRLRAELDELGPDAAIETIIQLPYLSAVCNETLRLHTLLAEVARVANRPVQLKGYDFQKGSVFMISIMAIHHDPDIYPDPDAFIPERFLGKSFSPFEFMPFGGGHRRCLGAALSDYEMRILLVEIITRWDFECVREEVDIRHDIAMGPKYGVPLRIMRRT